MNNYHYTILASDNLRPQKTGGEVMDWVVDINIRHANSEQDAIDKAKQIIKRKHYKLRIVTQCDCVAHRLDERKRMELSKKALDITRKQFGQEE